MEIKDQKRGNIRKVGCDSRKSERSEAVRNEVSIGGKHNIGFGAGGVA